MKHAVDVSVRFVKGRIVLTTPQGQEIYLEPEAYRTLLAMEAGKSVDFYSTDLDIQVLASKDVKFPDLIRFSFMDGDGKYAEHPRFEGYWVLIPR